MAGQHAPPVRSAPPSQVQDMARAAIQLQREKRALRTAGPETLADFCHLMDDEYEETRVTQLICRELEAVERGETTRLILMMPPREGKTLHASWNFPAWYLGRHPRHQIILASYNDDRAQVNSRHVRDMLDSEKWPYKDVAIRADTRAAGHWETTAGGVLHAAGTSGGTTGYGAHLFVVDDYIKDHEEADSDTKRDSVWEWWQTVATTRRMPGARFIVVATRWNEDDLIGRILNSAGADRWKVVEVPMIAREDDPRDDPFGRPRGEYLNGRIPQEEVPSVELEEITDQDFAALYQQNPQTELGNLFKRNWWQFYDFDEEWDKNLRPTIITVDSAFSLGPERDYSCAAVWGLHGDNAYVMDLWHERVEFPVLLTRLRGLYEKWQVPLFIEDQGSGKSAVQVMHAPTQAGKAGIPVVAVKTVRGESKEQRARQVTQWVQVKRVFLPKDTVSRHFPWREAFIEQHAAFPHGAHDDMVDTTSIALKHFFKTAVLKPSSDPASRWRGYRVTSTPRVAVPTGRDIGRDLFGARR